MSLLSSGRRRYRRDWRVAAAAVAAVAVVGGAVAVAPHLAGHGAAGHARVTPAADVAQVTAAAVCSTTGPGGTWVITPGGVATLPPPGTGSIPSQQCGGINLPNPAQSAKIQQCAVTLQEARQQIASESAQVLFSSFMENLIQNNAGQWASELASAGDQGPAAPASSQQVSQAISQVSVTDYNLANSIAQALVSLLNNSFETPLDCPAGPETVPNWYSNAFKALADDDTAAQAVNQALQAVASQVAQWAQEGVSPSGTVTQGGVTSQ
jgi:hypothetical protein